MKTYIVQSKNNELIKKSSSGGMFAELAKYVLSKSGVVFGCTMERVKNGFDVKHIYIEDEKDLYKLQGSKYVQSNIGNTIKQTREFLKQGRLVLFSGTPCQIAGLKAYLKQDYENLLTVDLSCTGTPSQEIFNDYIKLLEKKYRKKIINFEFRNKEKLGWTCGNAIITFENGKNRIIYNDTSSYLNLFINKFLQKPNCQVCKFSGLERISDITLSDAWGAMVEYPDVLNTKFETNKGISLTLINTQKGENYLEAINNNLIIEETDIKNLLKYNNPLNKSKNNIETKYIEAYKNGGYKMVENLFKKEHGLKYYFYKIKNYTPKHIKTILKFFFLKQKKTDCLLMTWYFANNYGSILTSYSLYKALEKLGYSSKFIHSENLFGFTKKFVKKYLPLTNMCIDDKDYSRLNLLTETFILGSDNLINLDTNPTNEVIKNLFNFTVPSKKRIMISGSVGAWDGTTENQKEHEYIKYLLERFDYISTREEHGKDVFENVFNVKADWINDPIFYLEKQDFEDLTKNVKLDFSDKIMEYILYPTEKTQTIVDFYKKKFGFDTVKFEGNQRATYFFNNNDKSVENWLSAVINSKLIITDSFHCVAFALIFNRPFICVKNTHATVRFTSLFKRLGINIPLIENVEDLENINLNYDTKQINKSLDNIRSFALNKIEQAMLAPKKEYVRNIEMEKYNEEFMKNNIPWYKKNQLFYFGIIVPFVIPIKRILANIKK